RKWRSPPVRQSKVSSATSAGLRVPTFASTSVGHPMATRKEKSRKSCSICTPMRSLPAASRCWDCASRRTPFPSSLCCSADPVGRGLVASLAHPGGNITGFTHYDAALAGKWVETLKAVAPQLTRVAVLFSAEMLAVEIKRVDSWLSAIESAAASFGIRSIAAGVQDGAEIERTITAFAAEPNGGRSVMPSAVFSANH